MMKVGSTTPACHGSKKTSISWRPRKYHGALDGLGVRVGLAGSSSGASTRSDHTIRRRMIPIEMRNSFRTRCGQVCTLSSPGPVAFLMGTSIRLPAGVPTARSGGLASGVAMLGHLSSASRRSACRRADQKRRMITSRKKNGMVRTRARGNTNVSTRSTSVTRLPVSSDGTATSDRRSREPVPPDAPEVNGHEETRDQRDEDAVQDVEAEQRVRTDLPAAEEERARVVDVVESGDELVPGSLVPEDGPRAPHVGTDRDRPDRELVPGQEVAGEGEEKRQHEEDDAHHPVELARGL